MPMIVAVPPGRSIPKACSAVALVPSASNGVVHRRRRLAL